MTIYFDLTRNFSLKNFGFDHSQNRFTFTNISFINIDFNFAAGESTVDFFIILFVNVEIRQNLFIACNFEIERKQEKIHYNLRD